MSLLTDDEIADAYTTAMAQALRPQDATAVTKVARAIEAAAIRKLATVSVEPCAWVDTDKGVIVGEPALYPTGTHGEVALYPAEALAAARVQAIEEAEAAVRKAIGDCDLGWAAQKAIRALIGAGG